MAYLNSHLSHPKYRPDIDGLRAIAVLSVVTFHSFPKWIKGGFTGVDIFFVISGYLISTIILENLDRGTFSFTVFYERRIKRIFPALILVLVTCHALGWFILFADEYQQLGKHIAAGAGFISNIVLWDESGYFDNSGETKPLLHLWSLGIEEQFYILWPFLLWISWKRKLNLFTITLLIVVGSFGMNVAFVTEYRTVAFYSPLTRFWELLCGGCLAWASIYKKGSFDGAKTRLDGWLGAALYRQQSEADGRTLSGGLSLAGILLLAYGFWGIDKEFEFPGKWALVPVVGALLIIAAGPKAWINRKILSRRGVVWVGWISYPLYLWHWPLLSFARILEGEQPVAATRLAAVAMSVLLAWLTFKFVERKVRLGGHGTAKVAVLVVTMILVGFTGYVTFLADGLVSRFSKLAPEYKEQIVKIARAWKFRSYPWPENSVTDPKYGDLRIGNNEKNVVLIIGDSHCQQYYNTVGEMYKNEVRPGREMPSVVFFRPSFLSSIDPPLLFDPAIKKVVFSYYWAFRYGSSKVNQAVRCCGTGRNGSIGKFTLPLLNSDQMDELDRKFSALITSLRNQGKEVYIILDSPFGQELDPHSMLVRNWKGFSISPQVVFTKADALARTEPVRSRIIRIAQDTGSTAIDPFEYLCNKQDCPAFTADGELIYKDYDHLSLFASTYIPYISFILQ